MDTKWRNISRAWYTRVAAYVLIVVFTVICFANLFQWTYNEGKQWIEVVVDKNYKESSRLESVAEKMAENTYIIQKKYASMEEIQKGTYAEEEVERTIKNILQEWPYMDENAIVEVTYDEDWNEVYYSWIEDVTPENVASDEEAGQVTEDLQTQTRESILTSKLLTDQNQWTQEALLIKNPTLKIDLKSAYIELEAKEYQNAKNYLTANQTMKAQYITNKEQLASFLKILKPIYVILGNHDLEKNMAREDYTIDQLESYLSEEDHYCVIAGMREKLYEINETEWNNRYNFYRQTMIIMIVMVMVSFLLMCYLMVVTGYRKEEKGVHLYLFDRLWSEIDIAAGVFILFLMPQCIYSLFYEVSNNSAGPLLCWPVIGMIVAGELAMIALILSFTRKIKAKTFIDSFLIVKVCKLLKKVMEKIWSQGKTSHKLLFLAVIVPIISATWIGVPIGMGIIIYFVYQYVGDFERICEGAKKIRVGELNHQIQVDSSSGEFYELADNLNQISYGLEQAVSKEVKSERLKSELISNVSHDLKTPLTSIVGYVELLKKEPIENEKAREYIQSMGQKVERLRVLTSDLFDAAKATSGDMPVNLENINLSAVVRQALGEYGEKLETAELMIKEKYPEEPVYVWADGRLTWRVLSNLLSNLVKYAQAKSRVYVEVSNQEEDGYYSVTIKNISAYELDIPAEELMERFKRGDASRHSEGSGLGLSIANSLVILQHGVFEIFVDGDLFKVIIKLPKGEKKEIL